MGKKNAKKVVMGLLVMAMIVTSVSIPKKTSEAAVAKISAVRLNLYIGGPAKKKIAYLTVKAGYTNLTKKCRWTSSNKKVVTVEKIGKVTAKKAGVATITAKYGKKSYKCRVTVRKYNYATPVSEPEDTETPVVTNTPAPAQQDTPVVTSTPTPVPTEKPISTVSPVVTSTPAPVQTTQPIVIPSGSPDGWGKLGDNISWYFYASSGVLELKGTGAMEDGKSPWNDYKSQIKAVKIGAGITRIGNSAFSSHKNLAKVELPDTVTELGESAFSESGLTSIDLSHITDLGTRCFYSCGKLTGNIIVPAAVEEIPYEAFDGCSSLNNITISEGISSIGAEAFEHSGIKEILIPSSVKSIGSGAFSDCDGLNEIKVPSTVEEMGSAVCSCCDSLKWAEWASACDISYQAFCNCDNLCVVKISGLIKTIDQYAFANGYKDVTISIFVPSSVTEIKYSNNKLVFYAYPDTEAYYMAGKNKEITFVDVSTTEGMNQWNTLWNQVTSGK